MKKISIIYPDYGYNGVRSYCENLYGSLDLSKDFIGVWFDEVLSTNNSRIIASSENEKRNLKNIFKNYIRSIKPDIIHVNTYGMDVEMLRFLVEEFGDRLLYTVHSVHPYHHPSRLFLEKPNIYTEEFIKTLTKLSTIDRDSEETIEMVSKIFGIKMDEKEKRELSIYSYFIALQKYLLENAKEIVHVSQNAKEKAREYYGIDKGIIINSGVSIFEEYEKLKEKYKLESSRWRIENGFEEKILLSYLGRINKNKGVLELLKVFEENFDDENDLVLIIGGYSEDSETIAKIKNSRTIGKKAFIIGDLSGLNKSQIISLYLASDIIVYPSYRESFALVPVEAMSLGKPVIVRKIDNMKNYVEEGWAYGFMNDRELVDNIRKLYEIISSYKKVGTNPENLEFFRKLHDGMNYVREKYSVSRMKEEYRKIFEKF